MTITTRAAVALTGRREAYYTDYTGSPQEFVSTAKYGYLYQGQWYGWQKQAARDAGARSAGASFVAYLENHDQVANSAFGKRLHQLSSPGRYRALTALTLLGPGDADAVSGAGVRRRRHRSSSSRTMARTCARPSPRAGGSFWRSFRAPRTQRCRPRCPPPGDRGDVPSLQARSRRTRAPRGGLRAPSRSARGSGKRTR